MCGPEGCITAKNHYVDAVDGSAVVRVEVTVAPERCKMDLEVLRSSVRNVLRIEGDVLWIGFPVADEVGYRILGLDFIGSPGKYDHEPTPVLGLEKV